ncbi:hypothetical protein ACFL6I_08810 [candidate division KSB1 bacterium]
MVFNRKSLPMAYAIPLPKGLAYALSGYFAACVCILLCSTPGFTQDDYFAAISNSRSRAVAMGGAITAVNDDMGAMSFNPGSYSLFEDRRGLHYTVALNPILPLVSSDQPDNFIYNRDNGLQSFAGALQYLVKSIGMSYKLLDIGILLNEEQIISRPGGRFFDSEDFIDNLYHTAVANIKLSTQVSIGVSGSYIRNSSNGSVDKGTGFSYGVLLKPSSIYQVGITYIDFSDHIPNTRKRFERLADESLNAGIMVMPWNEVILSVDVRNLTDSDKQDNFGLQEFHFGFEISRIPHLALRGGYYREKDESLYTHVYSAGVGLLDVNRFRPLMRKFDHKTPLLSYTMLFENTPLEQYRWHFLTLGLQF